MRVPTAPGGTPAKSQIKTQPKLVQQLQAQPQRQPQQPQAQPQPQPQQPSSGERSIMDLRKLIVDFLSKIEGALYTPYDLAKAQKDHEQIAMALAIIEKGMDDRDMLNITDKDVVKPGASTLESLHHRAVQHKSAVDAEFQKISAAAATAKSQGES